MEQLLSEGSRRQRRLPIYPRWKQWGSRSRVLSPGGGVREEGHASTQSSNASALKLEELRESFLVDGWRGGGSWLHAKHGCRGSDSGGGGLCVNLGQKCLCLTCKQEQKDIPAHKHLHVQRKHRLTV